MRYCVYGLIDPRDGSIFYVGQTSDWLERRAQHQAGTDQLSGLKVRELRLAGFMPQVVVFERCRNETASLSAEVFWIEMLMGRGAKLLNAQATGGYEGRARTRGRLSRALAFLAAATGQSSGFLTPAMLDRSTDRKPATKRLRNIANGRPAKAYRPWTGRDEARLKGMIKAGMSAAAIADALERTMTEIEAKLRDSSTSDSLD